MTATHAHLALKLVNLLNPVVHFNNISRKGGTGGGVWDHLQCAVHMATARLGCKMTMVGTGLANSWPGYMSRLRKHYPHISGGSLLAENTS